MEIFFTKGFFFTPDLLDTCSDWKKNFHRGPPPLKKKIFDTKFGLIHVQTGKKFFAKYCFLQNFSYTHFIELTELSVSQFSSE